MQLFNKEKTMKHRISRRDALKLAAAGLASSAVACTSVNKNSSTNKTVQLTKPVSDVWANTHDRIWIGGEYWANPMEDWHIVDGGTECKSTGGNRSIHSLAHQLTQLKPFNTSVVVKRLNIGSKDGGAGLRLGAKNELNEYRSNCFVQSGYDLGIIDNQLILGEEVISLSHKIADNSVNLILSGEPRLGMFALKLEARLVSTGKLIAQMDDIVALDKLTGNIGVVSNFKISSEQNAQSQGTRYRFTEWRIEGEAFSNTPTQKFGPILWTMYSLNNTRTSDGFVIKLSAFTGPMGENDNQELELQIKNEDVWRAISKATLNPDGWIATFTIKNWDETRDAEYRVVYKEKQRDGSEKLDVFDGLIQSNPSDEKLRLAAMTCQNDYAFPYAPVAENVQKLNPHMLLFSGDQIYENHGGFGHIREPSELAILNYLRKFYQFGWAFREAMRNAPTVCLPDDHDVLQGNIWGEGGAAFSEQARQSGRSDAAGGYIEPVRVVNTVHRTHTAHLPDPVDPRPAARGMTVYYTELVYGQVSFAILADRQWKSGPERLNIIVGQTGEDEAPGYINRALDKEGLELLGQRQEAFLSRWGKDWRDHKLKAVLSQTVFAGISTHQPLPNRYLKYDFDSSGWPASARNRAISIMRESKALHICGDTHLGTLSQYGVDKQRDSNWAFCTPAIAAGWPRWWRPDEVNLMMNNRPSHGLSQTGEYLDSFGNKIYVYAVGNPVVGKSENRYIQAHEKGSGFGVVTFDTKALSYKLEAYRFLVDLDKPTADMQFPGWPVIIYQKENGGENLLS